MADVRGGDAVFAKEALLKRKDAEQMLERLAHGADAASAPGPGLGGDQVHHRDAGIVEFAGEAQVKIGTVGKNGEIRVALPGRADKLAELAVDPRNMP